MKPLDFTAAFGTALLLLASVTDAKHDHVHANLVSRRHKHHQNIHTSRAENGQEVSVDVHKRGGQCQFPSDAGLVAVTPGSQNAGWAMSPDQPCLPGHYCPYACPPGKMMAQWDPDATSYSYPQSMNGGLFCDKDGSIKKPFPNKPYCMDGTGSVSCTNKASRQVAFCQTVLPGNEAMLIPTSIEDAAELTVPGPDYWAGTAAHFYINPPGVSTEEACVWGSKDNPWGNWSPYVAGANTDKTGNTFVKLAWNPIYLGPATPFRDKMPTWGVEIVCEGGGCNGLPCAIDPSKHSVNEISAGGTIGVGGASFCVVTVPKGSKANFVVFEGKNSGGSSPSNAKPSSSSSPPPPSSSPAPPSSSPAPPSSSPAPPSSSPAPPSSSHANPPSPSSSLAPTPTSSSSALSSSTPPKPSSSSSTPIPSSSSSTKPPSSSSPSSSASPSMLPADYFRADSASATTSDSSSDQAKSTTTATAMTAIDNLPPSDGTSTDTSSSTQLAYSPHIFVENSTATSSFLSASMSAKTTQSLAPSATAASTATMNSKSAAQAISGSVLYSCLSLILALLVLGL